MDKAYYDYDYKEYERKPKTEIKVKSKEEVGAMLRRFGFNTKLRDKKESPEELQRLAMEEEEHSAGDCKNT